MNANSFDDCSEADNYYEEESNSDLESRLYANVHYAPIENEIPLEMSDTTQIFSTSMENVHNTVRINNDEKNETNSNRCVDNDKSMEHNLNQSKDKEEVNNEADKAVRKNLTERTFNIVKDPYVFDINVEDQSTILPIRQKKKKRKKKSRERENEQLPNFPFKVPNRVETSSKGSNNIDDPSVSHNNAKDSVASNVDSSSKKSTQLTKKKQNAEDIFTKYQGSKQSLNKIYNEKQKELEEINTKYSVLEKRAKEMLQDNKLSNNVKEGDSDSDSDQSIFEVPVPPKPQPPLINLNDSDEDNTCTNNEDTIPTKRLTIENCNTVDFRNQVKRALSKTQSQLISTNNSGISNNATVNEDITLNCTEIRKGASSIDEIRDMRKDVQKKKNSPSVKERGSNILQLSAEVDNNKNKSGERLLGNKDKSHVDKAFDREKSKSTYLADVTRKNGSETVYTEITDDVFPADEFIRSQNKLNANKKRQLENQHQSSSNIKRSKKNDKLCQSGASTTNINSKTQENKKTAIDNSYFQPMSEKLRAFYTNSRGQENYDIDEVQSKMSKDPRLWAILDEDVHPQGKRQRFWNVKCTHCHQYGHQRYHCPEPRRTPKCYMCGTEGHTEVRAPQKMCLTCGKSQGTFRKTCETCRTFYCTMCNAVGHKNTECPDLWRRYHQTTTTNDVSIPSNSLSVMKPANLLICCNCTKRGHDSSMCKDYRWSQHFPTPAFVSNYTDGPTYIEKQSKNSDLQFLDDVNVLFENDTNNGVENNTFTVCASDLLLFPKELLQRRKSRKKAFLQNIPQLSRQENEYDVSYTIYQCGEFYTLEENGMEIKYDIIARKGFNTYKIMTCEVIPSFLEKLLELFSFEVKIYKKMSAPNEIVLRVRTFFDLINDLCRLILYWLSLEDDEKDFVISLDLPLKRKAMIKILHSKIQKFGTQTGIPSLLYDTIVSLKKELLYARNDQEYDNILSRLQDTQFKLLMILYMHPSLCKITGEIHELVRALEQSTSENVPLQQYLQILTIYNFLFVPHTPAKILITRFGKSSNPAVILRAGKRKKKSKLNINTPKEQTVIQNSSQIPITVNRMINYSDSQTHEALEVNSTQTSEITQNVNNMSYNTIQNHISSPMMTEMPQNLMTFDNNNDQNNTLRNYRPLEHNNQLEKMMIQNETYNNDLVVNRDMGQYESVSSHNVHPMNISEKYTNITVLVNKDQVHNTGGPKSSIDNCEHNEIGNINKCTNITFNVSNKNHTHTAANIESNIDDSKNNKRQNTNKYTNITVSVSNKNQTRTTTSFQSNVDNAKSNKHQNSNKYTNITVSVSDKNQMHPISTTSNLNNYENNEMSSFKGNDLKSNQFNNDDDVVCIEIKNKVPSHGEKQQTNKQQNNSDNTKQINNNTKDSENNKNQDKNKANNNNKQLRLALHQKSVLNAVKKSIKKGLKSEDLNDWKPIVVKIKKMIRSCPLLHIVRAANMLHEKIFQNEKIRYNVYAFHRLINMELRHQEDIIKLFKCYKPQSRGSKKRQAKNAA